MIASKNDDVGGIVNAGSVMLVNGTTGVPIATLAGDATSDSLGSDGITALTNNNFVIASTGDNTIGVNDSASVTLINGTTGEQIGAAHNGVNAAFSSAQIVALENGNYAFATPNDDVDGNTDSGSVRLINGTTGEQIGNGFEGAVASDKLGLRLTALANSNFVIGSPAADVGGIVNAGSVMLINGTIGGQIGATLAGDTEDDQLGNKIIALATNNFVIASSIDNVNGIVNAGSVILVEGTTGIQIGTTLAGDVAQDKLGVNGITALANGSFVC